MSIHEALHELQDEKKKEYLEILKESTLELEFYNVHEMESDKLFITNNRIWDLFDELYEKYPDYI